MRAVCCLVLSRERRDDRDKHSLTKKHNGSIPSDSSKRQVKQLNSTPSSQARARQWLWFHPRAGPTAAPIGTKKAPLEFLKAGHFCGRSWGRGEGASAVLEPRAAAWICKQQHPCRTAAAPAKKKCRAPPEACLLDLMIDPRAAHPDHVQPPPSHAVPQSHKPVMRPSPGLALRRLPRALRGAGGPGLETAALRVCGIAGRRGMGVGRGRVWCAARGSGRASKQASGGAGTFFLAEPLQ